MRTLALLLLTAAASIAQTHTVDADGWDQIHWGMTLDQVCAAYPGSRTDATEWWTFVILPHVTIADASLTPDAAAKHGTSQVTQISLNAHFGLPDDQRIDGPATYEKLRDLLVQKYGERNMHQATTRSYNNIVQTITWVLPSTTIELSLSKTGGDPNLGAIRILYRRNDSKSRDVL